MVRISPRASYLALHSSLFRPDCAVNYDYIVTDSINSLLAEDVYSPNLPLIRQFCRIVCQKVEHRHNYQHKYNYQYNYIHTHIHH